jgi:hypothetical protein
MPHSISAVPPFPGLRRFPDGRDFQQWTGNDSKALMKVRLFYIVTSHMETQMIIWQVYVAAISGHVPDGMVKCLSAFLDFCYIARRNAITRNGLSQLRLALARFHLHRDIFIGTAGVKGDRISLP